MKLWILLEEMQEELEFLNPRIYNLQFSSSIWTIFAL
jgi:hypothetical protein